MKAKAIAYSPVFGLPIGPRKSNELDIRMKEYHNAEYVMSMYRYNNFNRRLSDEELVRRCRKEINVNFSRILLFPEGFDRYANRRDYHDWVRIYGVPDRRSGNGNGRKRMKNNES